MSRSGLNSEGKPSSYFCRVVSYCMAAAEKEANRSLGLSRVDSVFINMPRMMAPEFPWGGNVKESGVGKSDSVCGMEEFTDLKFICTSYS